MATGLQARYQAATDPLFLQRVAQALIETAVTVYAGESVKTSQRALYATLVATDPPLSMVSINAQGVSEPDRRVYAVARLLTTQGLDGTSTDAQITSGVGTVWNALAGA